MPSNFSLLLDELHAADQARQPGAPLAKAGDASWISNWARGRLQRDSAAGARSLRANLDAMDRLTAQAVGMRKAMPTPRPSPATAKAAFGNAYARFTEMVRQGQFTAADAARIEAHFHHLGDRLHAAGCV